MRILFALFISALTAWSAGTTLDLNLGHNVVWQGTVMVDTNGLVTSPTNGLLLNGNFGIGVTNATNQLEMSGQIYARNVAHGDLSGNVFGLEYLYAFHKKLMARQVPTIVLAGDSTTAGDGIGDTNYFMHNILRNLIASDYWDANVYNDAVSGTSYHQWRYDQVTNQIARNPDLLVVRHGINDGPLNRETFEEDMRAGLAAVRATRSLAQTAILLMAPTSVNDTPGLRDEAWFKTIIPIIRRAARDYQCTFIDTFTLFRDAEHALWMDDPFGDGRHIHPTEAENLWIANVIMDVIMPASVKKLLGTANYRNPTTTYKLADVSATVSEYPLGISSYAATSGFPQTGQVTTIFQSGGAGLQINSGSPGSGVSLRTGTYGIGWNGWLTPVMADENGNVGIGTVQTAAALDIGRTIGDGTLIPMQRWSWNPDWGSYGLTLDMHYHDSAIDFKFRQRAGGVDHQVLAFHNGLVGINWTNQTHQLDVGGDVGLIGAGKLYLAANLISPSYIQGRFIDNYYSGLDFHTFAAGVDYTTLSLSEYGRVGVGVTNPVASLDVMGNGAASGASLSLRNGDTAAGENGIAQVRLGYGNTTNYAHSIRTRHSGGSEAGNAIDFWVWKYGTDSASTLGSRRVMTLDGTGNAGIGDSAPNVKLSVLGESGSSPMLSLRNSSYGSTDSTGSVSVLMGFANHGIPAIELKKNGAAPYLSDLNFYAEVGFNDPYLGLSIKGDSYTPTVYIPGNVGIGTASPGARLHTVTTGDYTGNALTLSTKEWPGAYSLSFSSTVLDSCVVGWGLVQTNYGVAYNPISFDRGRIGLNLSAPNTILSVYTPYASLGTLYPVVTAQNGATTLGGMYSVPEADMQGANGLSFMTFKQYVGLYEAVRIANNGNVGIGYSNPQNKLVVSDGRYGMEVSPNSGSVSVFGYDRGAGAYIPLLLGGGANSGFGIASPWARVSIGTPDAYTGNTLSMSAQSDANYSLTINADTTAGGVVRWNMVQTNNGARYNALAIDRGNVVIGDPTSDTTNKLQVNGSAIAHGTVDAHDFKVAGAATSGQFLRGNGTNIVLAAIDTYDLPQRQLAVPAAKNWAGDSVRLYAAETLSAGDLVYVSSDGYVSKAQANSATTQAFGLITDGGTTGQTVNVLLSGLFTTSGLTAGYRCYLSQTTAGAFTTTQPTNGVVQVVGVGISSGSSGLMRFNPTIIP